MKKNAIQRAALLFGALFLLSAAGCAAKNGGGVFAQSVASMQGGSIGINDRFAGLTVAGNTAEIKPDAGMTVAEIRVKEGQLVKKDDVLFTYDDRAANYDVEQLSLEIEGLNNSIKGLNSQIAELEQERAGVEESEKLRYTLEIQSLQADIRETQYNISVKQKELEAKKQTAGALQVKAPIDGRVTKVASPDETEENAALITLVETGNLRVKGVINELSRGSLSEGDRVLIRSRADAGDTWSGKVEAIDWEHPESGENNMYMTDNSGNEMTASSKYPFYVTLEDAEGLIVGQHVYIERSDAPAMHGSDALLVPACFICDAENAPWVWAAGKTDRLEQRSVVLGDYIAALDSYEIQSGVTAQDCLAFPTPELHAGDAVTRVAYSVQPDDALPAEDGPDGEAPADAEDLFFEDGAEADAPAAFAADGSGELVLSDGGEAGAANAEVEEE